MRTQLAWRALHRTGLLRAYRRLRQRRTLTVVAFHRVLPEGDARWFGADPSWTVSAELFRECLGFFARHYAVVGLERVLAARSGGPALPDHALLVTFDDGWADTAEVALPILTELGLPATVFVVSGAVGATEPFWQEQVFSAWSEGRLSPPEADRLWRDAALDEAPPPPTWGVMEATWALVARLERLEESRRTELLEARRSLLEQGGRAAMVSRAGLRELCEAGVRIGSHGRTHRPLTRVEDPVAELRGSRSELAELMDGIAGEGPLALSFPHGATSPELEELALECGYQLLFTSAEQLERVGPRGPGECLGRIPIDGRELLDGAGRFRPELLARWLVARPVRG